MANNVKVSGYAQRVFYNNGIEYRNFSDSLVGNQITSPNAVFTSGNFTVETNFDAKISKNFKTKKFSPFMNLDDLKVDQVRSANIQGAFNEVKLNLDKSKLEYYAYFGSLVEYIRVSLEDIIMKWPASLYVQPFEETMPITGYTSENYTYDILKNESTFEVKTNLIVNKFDISHKINGTLLNTYNETNDSRNLSVNYSDYVISINGKDSWSIIGFTGNTNDFGDKLVLKIKGDIFSGQTNSKISYHIRPKNDLIEEFFASLPDFESHLLNRLTVPKYKSSFEYKAQTETGLIINTSKELIWPTTDGYNIDFDTTAYVNFVRNLIEIGEQSDKTKSNIIVRHLVATSISDFDTTPNCNGEYEETAGQKMNRTLSIYGRGYDETKRYIDGIQFANTVTYNKKDNTPDLYLKNIARVLGWELVSSVLENDLLQTFLTPKDSSYSGHSRGYTAYEAEVEMWRRLILNTPWIWKSKGTRKSIDFFLRFIGTPTGLVTFNEYIYRVKEQMDMDVFNDILYETYGTTNVDGLNIDSDGFPKVYPDTPDMYFQKGGQWYRETTGVNSNNDILVGNNPHMGPYDNGQEYLSQFDCLIPNFEPVLIRNENLSDSETNIFTNYNSGLVNNSLDENVYIDSVNGDNIPVTCYDVIAEIIEDPKPQTELTDCGCETGEGDDAIKISVKKKDTPPEEPSMCNYTGFTLNGEGYVIFNLPNNTTTTQVTQECCEALNFTYESNSSTSCLWKTNTTIDNSTCNGYLPDGVNGEGVVNWSNPTTQVGTQTVSRECCESFGYDYSAVEGGYMCYDNDGVGAKGATENTCNQYTPYQTNFETGIISFIDSIGNITTNMRPECCEYHKLATVRSRDGFNCKNRGYIGEGIKINVLSLLSGDKI